MELIRLELDTPIAFTVDPRTFAELKPMLDFNMLDWYDYSREQTPGATEIEDEEDAETIPNLFKLRTNPPDRCLLRYYRKRTREGENRYETVESNCINRGYVFGSAEDCDVRLPDKTSGYHCRIYFNQHRVWMVYNESSSTIKVNGDTILPKRLTPNTPYEKKVPREEAALHPERVNSLKISHLKFKLRVNVDSKNFTQGCSERLVLERDSTLNTPTTTSFSMSHGATPIDVHGNRSSDSTPLRQSYHVLTENFPVARHQTKRLIHKWTGKPMFGQSYANDEEEKNAHFRYSILAPILQAHNRLLAYFDEHETDVDPYMIVTEQIDAGSLEARLATEDPLSRQHLTDVFFQIISALEYVHSKNLIHRDVRPGTILSHHDPQRGAFLTGFSECHFGPAASDIIGDDEYRAPEIGSSKTYDAKVDVYSLCTVVRSYPAPVSPWNQTWRPEKLSPEVQTILGLGLVKCPTQRYTSAQICDVIQNLSGNRAGPPFQPLRSLRTFDLHCDWCSFERKWDYHVQEPDLWRIASFCFDIGRSEYETLVRLDNPAWPSHVPFELAKQISPDSLESCLSVEDEKFRPRRPDTLVRSYTHCFHVYYHTLSKMANLTHLLRATGLQLESLDFRPSCLQEVYGAPKFEGLYVDAITFESLWEQANTLLEVQRSNIGSIPDILRDPASTTISCTDSSAHHERFISTDYNEHVIVFAGWRMILVRRADGSANLNQVQKPESAWQASVPFNFVSAQEAAAACEEQGLEPTAKVLRYLGGQPPQEFVPIRHQQVPEIVPLEADDVDKPGATKKVAEWLEEAI